MTTPGRRILLHRNAALAHLAPARFPAFFRSDHVPMSLNCFPWHCALPVFVYFGLYLLRGVSLGDARSATCGILRNHELVAAYRFSGAPVATHRSRRFQNVLMTVCSIWSSAEETQLLTATPLSTPVARNQLFTPDQVLSGPLHDTHPAQAPDIWNLPHVQIASESHKHTWAQTPNEDRNLLSISRWPAHMTRTSHRGRARLVRITDRTIFAPVLIITRGLSLISHWPYSSCHPNARTPPFSHPG